MKPHQYAGCALAIGLAMVPLDADARPVSYPSGWTVMQMNNGDMSSAHIHYSPTFTDSIGLYSERNWGEDWHFTGVQYNRLVKRWNKPNSQANLYLKAAVWSGRSLRRWRRCRGGRICRYWR